MSLDGTWKNDEFANLNLIFNKPNFEHGYLLVTLHRNNECRTLFNELMFFRRFNEVMMWWCFEDDVYQPVHFRILQLL